MNKIMYLLILIFSLSLQNLSANNLTPQKTLLITGAAGFIGSNFLSYIFNKYPDYHILALDNFTYAGNKDNISETIYSSKRFELHKGSITNPELVQALLDRSDFVVHFAAESHVTHSIKDSDPFIEANIIGTQVLLNALKNNQQNMHKVERFIYISTSEVYGTASNPLEPMDENHPLNPRTPYAGSKAAADRLVYAFYNTYNLPIVIIRPFNNYGPYQHIEKLIPHFITLALQNKPLTIHGNGTASRDWLHVSDHCQALDIILHIQDFDMIKNQVINLGTGQSYSILEIAQMILHHLQLPQEEYLCFIEDRPGQVFKHISSQIKARDLLGWQATISFEEGLYETIQWYKNNSSWWKNKN
jgi:dTDP-glucose 4,6-dehydratase